MGQEMVAMSTRELDRLEVVRRVAERSLTQTKAAELMGLCERQVRRLGIAYAERGPCWVGVRPPRKVSRRSPRVRGPGAESRDCSGLTWTSPTLHRRERKDRERRAAV